MQKNQKKANEPILRITQDHRNETFKIASKEIKVAFQVALLREVIDNKLNFEQHISYL